LGEGIRDRAGNKKILLLIKYTLILLFYRKRDIRSQKVKG